MRKRELLFTNEQIINEAKKQRRDAEAYRVKARMSGCNRWEMLADQAEGLAKEFEGYIAL